jgi:hypothetical protein
MSHFGLEHIPIWPTMPTRPGGATGDNIIDALADVTCDLSTVNGTAFISNPSFPLDWAVNRLITLTAGGKTLTGYGKAAGTGETVSDIITGGGFEAFTAGLGNGWSKFGAPYAGTYTQESTIKHGGASSQKIATAAESFAFQQIAQPAVSYPAGTLVKRSLWVYADGIYSLNIAFDGVGPSIQAFNTVANTWTEGFGGYITSAYSYTAANLLDVYDTDATTGVFYFDDIVWGAVTAPSATGITIVSTQGGATRNWASDDGIDPDAASFTLTISF